MSPGLLISQAPGQKNPMPERSRSPLVISLRVAALLLALVLVFVVCRALSMWPWWVDFLLAVALAALWAYRFER